MGLSGIISTNVLTPNIQNITSNTQSRNVTNTEGTSRQTQVDVSSDAEQLATNPRRFLESGFFRTESPDVSELEAERKTLQRQYDALVLRDIELRADFREFEILVEFRFGQEREQTLDRLSAQRDQLIADRNVVLDTLNEAFLTNDTETIERLRQEEQRLIDATDAIDSEITLTRENFEEQQQEINADRERLFLQTEENAEQANALALRQREIRDEIRAQLSREFVNADIEQRVAEELSPENSEQANQLLDEANQILQQAARNASANLNPRQEQRLDRLVNRLNTLSEREDRITDRLDARLDRVDERIGNILNQDSISDRDFQRLERLLAVQERLELRRESITQRFDTIRERVFDRIEAITGSTSRPFENALTGQNVIRLNEITDAINALFTQNNNLAA